MSDSAPNSDLSGLAAPQEPLVHYAPHPEQELIMHLEPDQLVNQTLRPVPRATLSRPATFGLWALRVFCVSVSTMVLYTFIDRLQ
jgi:hypothetical protein